MPTAPKTYRYLLAGGIGTAILSYLCVLYVDIPVAVFVRDHLYANRQWSSVTSNIPDLLLTLVIVSMLGSLVIYLARRRKGINDALTQLALEVMWAAPASYLAKALLKIAFGRWNTRHWLQNPEPYGFHFFQRLDGADAFPSGHMVVIVTLFAAAWRFYPWTRPIGLLAGLLLAVLLVATNYHFVADVVAGVYIGMLVEIVVFHLVFRNSRHEAAGGR